MFQSTAAPTGWTFKQACCCKNFAGFDTFKFKVLYFLSVENIHFTLLKYGSFF
jgi:hypothetical protein